jgi:fatty acid desaturase
VRGAKLGRGEVLRYQLTIRKSPSNSESDRSERAPTVSRVKAALAAFLALSVTTGVLLAAFILGSVLAALILILVVVATCAWFFFRLWHRVASRHETPP